MLYRILISVGLILLAVVAAIALSGDPPKSNTAGVSTPAQQDEPVQRGLKTE